MDTKQIELVQTSFAEVEPITDVAAKLFYGQLFILDPSLQPLFKSDMKEQRQKLMQMLAVVVDNLDDLEAIAPAVQQLAQRHVAYGVPASSYDKAGEALLWTLAQGLGNDFTPEVEKAWTAAYGSLATVMKEVTYDAESI